MPRRRALRAIGGVVLGAAAPGALAGVARAATAAPKACTGCGVPHGAGCVLNKKCGEVPGAPVCCKWPGYFGPSKNTNGGLCAQAGGHGLQPPGGLACCCPTGTTCGHPPGEVCVSKKKTCGPDITGALEAALSRVKAAFASWSGVRRYDACIGLVTLPGAAVSWDVRELGPGGRADFSKNYPDCESCGNSVQVGSGCHYAGSVNYVAYGVMMRLCHDYLSREKSLIADWFSREEMLELIYIHKNLNWTLTQGANLAASNEWANAGYQSGSVRPTPPGDRPECKERCTKPYSGPGLTINWLPNVIRP
jgi:hypothetical protein